jgi:hypothetical protein
MDQVLFPFALSTLIFGGVWASIRLFKTPRWSLFYRTSVVITTIAALPITHYFTNYFVYFANPNTQIYGWPIPKVVFQRSSPTGPWLDFLGPTVFLAFPLNFIVFSCTSALVLWGASSLQNKFSARSS